MPTKGVSMRKLLPMLRLHYEAKMSARGIARSLNLSVGVVSKYLIKAKECTLSWPLPTDMSEQALLTLLRPSKASQKINRAEDSIDFPKVHQEMKAKGVTLQLLWEEYKDEQANPLSYSRYCFHYRAFKKKLKRSMRQTHKAGDKAFIDYSGKTVDIIDPETGLIRPAEIFVGALGASNYTFSEATWSQKLPDFLASQRRMFEFFGGVPALIVPDNLKSAVSKTCRYEPDINPTYAQFIEHYGTAVLPARPYRPKDKPKAEGGVQLVQRWILAKLRHCTFVGLAELNAEISRLLTGLNQKSFQKLEGSRESSFLTLDKPALRPLPDIAYEYKQYKSARAGIDYHVSLEGHNYSVPHQYCGEVIDLWFNQYTVECYLHGDRIASHLYSNVKGGNSTIEQHMPVAHQKQSQQSKERYLKWAADIGSSTKVMVEKIFARKPHTEQACRSCLGLLRLTKQYGEDRLDNACRYALNRGIYGRKRILSILKNNLEKPPGSLEVPSESGAPPMQHENIRGAYYYH